jgi:hypothetical protein
MPRPGPGEYIDDPLLELGFEATMRGAFCLRVLVQSIEQGADELPIDPRAWENTMAAVEWMISQHIAGALYTEPRVTQEDLDRARRVHALGSVAISGGERAPDLLPLAEACASSMVPGWRAEFAAFPVRYPPAEDDLS